MTSYMTRNKNRARNRNLMTVLICFIETLPKSVKNNVAADLSIEESMRQWCYQRNTFRRKFGWKETLDLITNSTLLKPLPADVISELLTDVSVRITEYLKDTVVHFEGDVCSGLEIILQGKIALERIDASGHVLTVGEFFKDDVLGGNLLFSKNPVYSMTVFTRESTLLMEIGKDALFALLSGNPDFLLTYLEFISDNAVILGEKIRHEIRKPIRNCVIDFLKVESVNQKSRTD